MQKEECPVCLESFEEESGVVKQKLYSCTHSVCTSCVCRIKEIEVRAKCPLCRTPFLFAPPRSNEEPRPNWRLPFPEDDFKMWEIYTMVREEKRRREVRRGRTLLYRLTAFEGDFMRRYVYCIEGREGYSYLASTL